MLHGAGDPRACGSLPDGRHPHLPDLPLRVFESETITASAAAHPMGIPDGLLGLASFGTTLALALLARRNGTAKKMLGGKLALDISAAAFNASRQIVSFGKLCSWCTGTALATGVMAYGDGAQYAKR